MNRKGIRPIHCLILLPLLLVGCWDRQELNHLAIISALGIEQAQDGKITVFTQEINPRTLK
ncbi:spore germination protein KC, partial [Desmospora sp. 8437]